MNRECYVCELCLKEKTYDNFFNNKKCYKKKICLGCYPMFSAQHKKRKVNINYRIKKSLAARLRNVLDKKDTTMNYIGCNIHYLREWFEFNFTPEMTWDNYGTYWSIDHIIPVNNFDLTQEKEKLRCWNWSNLVPVPVKYNASKKNIDITQVHNNLINIDKFKEKGSTTKWFSGDVFNMDNIKQYLPKI